MYCFLVGNKSDLRNKKKRSMKESRKAKKGTMESEKEESMVAKELGKQFADENGMPFLESTATTGKTSMSSLCS